MKPITIDCHYFGPEHAASYLLIEEGSAAFIENNTAKALPHLLEALIDNNLRPEDVRYIIITHLHLDHAGGTSALVEKCPNATVLAHPRAVRHLVDPFRLVASAKSVYGEDQFDRLYSPIKAIEENRVKAMADNETLRFGGRTLTFLHTRGHANHHFCILDSSENSVYTGDTFGVEYRRTRICSKPFLLCSTAPTEFDPAEARASIRRILALDPARLYPTHYGELEDVAGGAEVLLRSLDAMESVLNEATGYGLTGPPLVNFCERRVREAIDEQVRYCNAQITPQDIDYIVPHANINAQGIALLAERRRSV